MVQGLSTLPWVEKYRPKTVQDVASQQEIVQVLVGCLESVNMPHLLFYGPPGTGKTSTALAVARQLYGTEWRQRVLELNASDDRGIAVVRNKVKSFANLKVGGNGPTFKIIILDEADSMTQDAQTALRRTMEETSKVTRFIFICNYVSRIIEPLVSRCAQFRFQELTGSVVRERLSTIAREEGVSLSEEVMETIDEVSAGDLRQAITLLQSASRLDGNTPTSATIRDAAASVPTDAIVPLVQVCRSGSFTQLQSSVKKLLTCGYPARGILTRLHVVLTCDDDVADHVKANVSVVIANTDKALVDGANELLQVLAVFAQLQRSFREGKKLPWG